MEHANFQVATQLRPTRPPLSFLSTLLSTTTPVVIGLLALFSFLLVGFYTNWTYLWPQERETRA
jgi:hypothetical protein